MNFILCASAWLALISHPQTPLQINVDAKSGDTISGERDFRVTVDSSDAINQVEFYVGDDLRDTETSTPYVFQFDTVNENDGDIKLRFKAYTVENKTVEKVLALHIDNETSKGADFHVKAGQDDLSDSKYQAALDQGRIAIKLDPMNNGARLVLARANLGLKVYDKAQKYAEDAVAQDPKDDSALQLLAGVDVRRAFSIFSKEQSDKADVLASIGDAFSAAVTARRKSLDLEVDQLGAPTSDNLIAYADAANRAERYSLTTSTLQSKFAVNPKDQKLMSRLAYAQLRSGRIQDALDTLTLGKSTGPLDAYDFALQSIVYLKMGRLDDSQLAIKAAIESDPDNLGVRTAQAYIALQQNKTAVLSSLATDLGRDEGQRPVVNYFLMALANRQQRFGDARRYFEKGILAEPANQDLYVEEANYSIGKYLTSKEATDKEASLNTAKMYYQTALIARPESVDALCGMSMVNLLAKNVADGVKFAEAARDSTPNDALGHYMAAAAYELAGRINDARTESDKAGELDTVSLKGRTIPDPAAVYRYMTTEGRTPVIVAPSN